MSGTSPMKFAVREAENLRNALKVVSAIGARNGSDPQNAFVHSKFPLELASVLVDLTQDAVTLQLASESTGGTSSTVVSFEDLREKCASFLQKVIADMITLEETDSDNGRKKPVTTSDSFVLELVQTISNIIECNVSALEGLGDHSSVLRPQLNMSTPRIVQYLVESLRRAADSHVARNKDFITCKEALLAAEERAAELRQEMQRELEEQSVAHRSALEKLETQSAQAAAEGIREATVAQSKIQRLEGELLSQKAAYEADARDQAIKHINTVAALQVEFMVTRQRLEHERLSALEEQKRLSTRCAELAGEKEELIRKLRERDSEKDGQVTEQEEAQGEKSPSQTGLTIRVPAPLSSRSPVSAGAKRTLEQTTETPASTASDSSGSDETSLPPRRSAELAKLPQVVVDLSASDGTPESFTRESVGTTLGGNSGFLLHVHVAQPTPLSSKYDLRWYLCVTMSTFAWLPSAPGAHGFLHMDVDRKVKNADGTEPIIAEKSPIPLFVGIRTGSPEVFQYYGMYRVTNAEHLSSEEWDALHPAAKSKIIEKLYRDSERDSKRRKKGVLSRTDIRAKFASGEYHVHCVRLECVQFDAGFYQDLVEAHRKTTEEDEAQSVEQQVLSSASKRRKVSGRADAD